jgi:hypothetical protein
MAETLIQSGAIGIYSGIGHRELGCMAVILHQVPATLALEECPHVKIPHSAPGRRSLSGLLDGDSPGHRPEELLFTGIDGFDELVKSDSPDGSSHFDKDAVGLENALDLCSSCEIFECHNDMRLR